MSETDTFKISERISSAIYFLSGFFEEREPLKWRLRTLATNIVSNDVKDKSSAIQEIQSLFLIARDAGLVSIMNHSIFIEELSKFAEEQKRVLNNKLLLPMGHKSTGSAKLALLSKERIKDKHFSTKNDSRREVIINVLRDKKEIMIKDILPIMTGYSSKTVQRELLAMVKDGILEKSGEKRWSRYFLA